MIHRPLPGRATGAVRDALLSHGLEGESSEGAAAALEPWAHHVTGLSAGQVEALLRAAPKFGVDLLTGEDWALVSATRARLSALARSWNLPPELHEVVVGIGTGLPAEPPAGWTIGGTVVDLSTPVVLERLPPGVAVLACGVGLPLTVPPAAEGILLRARDGATAVEALTAALDAVLTAGVDLERVALDPAWEPGRPALALHRRFGRPLAVATDDPVAAVLGRQAGAQLFLTAVPDVIRRALSLADTGA